MRLMRESKRDKYNNIIIILHSIFTSHEQILSVGNYSMIFKPKLLYKYFIVFNYLFSIKSIC